MIIDAWAEMAAHIADLGCKVRWSNPRQICFSVPDGCCHWTYDGIELSLFGFRAPMHAFTVPMLTAELTRAQSTIAEARKRGAKVEPVPAPPPPSPRPQPSIIIPAPYDPFKHVDD